MTTHVEANRREDPSFRASPVVSSAEHRTAERAEQSQDRPDDQQKNPDSPQYRAMDQEPHDKQNDTKSDHDRYATTQSHRDRPVNRHAQ